MRAQEFATETQALDEIERLTPSAFSGGKDYLDSYGRQKSIRELPGGSGLLYSVTNDSGDFIIRLWDRSNKGEFQPSPIGVRPSYYSRREWDSRVEHLQRRDARRKEEFDRSPGKLIGQLTVNVLGKSFPIPGAVQVGTITVDEDYRGVGLAKALYGIVLTIMKRPLVAGDSQTPGGRRNWVSLSQIPGVQMKGYFAIDADELEPNELDPDSDAWQRRYAQRTAKKIDKHLDVIMGQLGGQYMGAVQNRYDNFQYFAFDVRPDSTGKELEAAVKTKLSKVYGGGYDSGGGLYAVWTGQA